MPSNPRAAPNGFVFRDGEPVNKFAWLGVAPLVRARRWPEAYWKPRAEIGTAELRVVSLALYTRIGLDALISCARDLEVFHWRRVLLPMLLAEAKKRGIDV